MEPLQKSDASALRKETENALVDTGLSVLGWFRDDQGKACLLVGNLGGALWPIFSQSPFATDGFPDPLDRWSRHILGGAAARLGCRVHFPFERPFKPFQQWSMAATGARPSPLGLLFHPEAGLWWALRGAFCFPQACDIPAMVTDGDHACESCVEKPCLSACPVEAFMPQGFDAGGCKAYLKRETTSGCRTGGCAARIACPVGRTHRYQPDHHLFHLRAFAGN